MKSTLEVSDALLEQARRLIVRSAPCPPLPPPSESCRSAGPRGEDAGIGAPCRRRGVRQPWSAGRGWRRFPQLRLRRPALGA